jgi:hypothetical protein
MRATEFDFQNAANAGFILYTACWQVKSTISFMIRCNLSINRGTIEVFSELIASLFNVLD